MENDSDAREASFSWTRERRDLLQADGGENVSVLLKFGYGFLVEAAFLDLAFLQGPDHQGQDFLLNLERP